MEFHLNKFFLMEFIFLKGLLFSVCSVGEGQKEGENLQQISGRAGSHNPKTPT